MIEGQVVDAAADRIHARQGLTSVPYSPYSTVMSSVNRKGAEEARNQLPALLAEAAKGRTTLITRHGRSVAAIVPVAGLAGGARQKPLVSLSGSGKGLWGKASARTVRRLREEWGP